MVMIYHLKRNDKEITEEDDMKKILRSAQYVTLAMTKDDQPYLVSLSHGYDEYQNCIYFHCAEEGKKMDYLRSNNTVWGQVLQDHRYHQGKCDHLYASVHFSGKVTFLDDPKDKLQALALMARQMDSDPEKLIAGWKPENLINTVVGKIDIEYMTGKKSHEVTI